MHTFGAGRISYQPLPAGLVVPVVEEPRSENSCDARKQKELSSGRSCSQENKHGCCYKHQSWNAADWYSVNSNARVMAHEGSLIFLAHVVYKRKISK